ncbi:MAG: XRE family transcriptional regulator [Proteobacteria bacterium]|nr:MAG: XRE family transcriptional regulator [Pseudomonadota bacterium]
MSKREIVVLFRRRLGEAMATRALNQSALSREAGVDRSTLSQLLSDDNVRMPRADTVAALAGVLQVSTDWLLGLSSDSRFGAEILRQSLEVAPHEPSPADANLSRWYDEAAGLKIRYVPANIPDIFKTEAVIEHEFGAMVERPVDRAIQGSRQQLRFSRMIDNDLEICLSLNAIRDFCAGHSLWQGLSREVRLAQKHQMVDVVEELYPSLRLYLFDGLRRYAAPYTVFGNRRAVLYIGQMYFAFNTREYVTVLIRHFDDLIRNSVVNAHEAADYIRGVDVS